MVKFLFVKLSSGKVYDRIKKQHIIGDQQPFVEMIEMIEELEEGRVDEYLRIAQESEEQESAMKL